MEGNFAQQMKQAISPEARNSMPPAPPQAPAPAVTGADPMGLMSPMGDIELPVGGQPESAKAEPAAAPEAPAKFKIGGREFDSMQAAYDFVAQEQARVQGKEEVLNKLQAPKEEPKAAEPPPTPWEKELADEFFRDPEAALRKVYEKAKADSKKEVFDRYEEMTAQQKAEQKQLQDYNQVWSNFYESHKDLSGDQDIVQYIQDRDWAELKDMPMNQSLPLIAERARKLLRRNAENSLPQQVLTNGPAVMAQGTSTYSRPVQSESTQENKMDMISQLRKLDRRIKA